MYLTQHSLNAWTRYGLSTFSLILVTLFRLVVPLDAAPFLLYLPVVFIISIALGRGPGDAGTILSAALAASFFERVGASWWQLGLSHYIAIIEYLLVSTGMVRVCVALRRILFANEAAVARLKAIVETVPVGILLAEAPSGRVLERNGRWDGIMGALDDRSDAITGDGGWRAFHADGRLVEAAEHPLARVLGGQSEAALQLQHERQKGSRVWIELSAAPIRDASGKVTGAVVAASDVDARKSAEAAREHLLVELDKQRLEAEQARDAAEGANRAKSAFLANMSHELRTPLSAVIGYTELLEEDADGGDPSTLVDLGKIKSNAKHLLGLINDILDLSKVEANKMELLPEDIELSSFLRDAAGTVDALVARKRNTLVFEVADDLGTMRTDAVKLRQCLFNLLSNAAKFTEAGTIALSARRESVNGMEWVLFSVRDSGIGMTPEQVSRLFQRFTQADETTTRKFGGTGLGLALSRAFARLMGGDIAAESKLGEGTTFTIRLPAVLSDKRPEVTPELVQAPETDENRGNLVLVIDDEASQRELMTRFLQRQGFVVRTAADGETGLELARTLLPRAVLLDVMMPGMDGWEVLKALKADPATEQVPVVMVSFVADAGLSASLGAADAVRKPIDWPRLTSVLTRLRQAGGNVLVVDDDADMRRRLRTVLEKSGWTIEEAANGEEALERVRAGPPHLILLDLTMPVMDGFSFLQHLRRTPIGAEIPVLVLSARDVLTADKDRLSEADKILRKGETSLREVTVQVQRLAREPQQMPSRSSTG